MRNGLASWGIALIVSAALAACSGDGIRVTQPNGTGHVSIALTDAPSDSIEAAVVTITDIYLQPGSDSLATANRVYLRQNVSTTVDLLALRDTLASLVESSEVLAGHYAQLRFVISGAYIEVLNPDETTSIYATSNDYAGLPPGAQVTGTLRAPSFAQSGLKVVLPDSGLEVTDGSTTSLVADFDVAQSFGHAAGNSGQWVLTPVVHAVSASATASLAVTVGLGSSVSLPPALTLAAFDVELTDANGNSRTAPLQVNANGTASATFHTLIPGNGPFKLTLVAPAGFKVTSSTPALPVTVNLNAGANTQLITLASVGAA